MSESSWRGVRVLVTGIQGFLAGHLAGLLSEAGAVVYGAARPMRRWPTAFDLLGLRHKVGVERFDIVRSGALHRFIVREGITHVFHLAAVALVDAAVRAPFEAFRVNVLGAASVCEACLRAGVTALVVSTSDKSYGPFPGRYVEGTPMRAAGIYECSKMCEDAVVQGYALNYGLNAACVRAGNLVGPGDLHPSRIVPRTVMRLLEGLPPMLRPGQGNVRRTYCPVADVARAFLAVGRHISANPLVVPAGANPAEHVGWNVGTDNEYTARQMMTKLMALAGREGAIEEERCRADRLVELPDQRIDCTKLREATGWTEQEDFDAYLEQTVAWYKEHRDVLRSLFVGDREVRRRAVLVA